MTKIVYASFTAIGSRLHNEYSPTLTEPLPSELQELVAQLVALESGKRKPNKQLVEALQPAIAQPGPHSK
jgi:hypothetical protein